MPASDAMDCHSPFLAPSRSRMATSRGTELVIAPTIAKLCSLEKQYFACKRGQTPHVGKISINAVFAANLRRRMDAAGLSQVSLGKKAGVAQRSVGNYLNPKEREAGAKGKEPSAKLAEMAMIASALGVEPWEMLIPEAGERDVSIEKQVLELSALFRGMSEKARSTLIQEARVLHTATRIEVDEHAEAPGESSSHTGTHGPR